MNNFTHSARQILVAAMCLISFSTSAQTVTAPTVTYDKLDIVGKHSIVVEKLETNVYDDTELTLRFDSVITKLGLKEDTFDSLVPSMIYMRALQKDGNIADTLSSENRIDVDWFVKKEGSDSCGARSFFDGNCIMTVNEWWYDTDHHELHFRLTQFPNSLKTLEKAFCTVYICNGNKAFQIDITMSIIEPKPAPVPIVVGDETIDVGEALNMSPKERKVHIDIEKIANELECDVNDIDFYTVMEDEYLSHKDSTDILDFVFNSEGYEIKYTSGIPLFNIGAEKPNDFSNWSYCGFNMAQTDTLRAKLAYVYQKDWYIKIYFVTLKYYTYYAPIYGDGIEDMYATDEKKARTYSICGMPTSASTKGIFIRNGKKYVR